MVTLSFSIYPKDDAGEVNHESRSFQNSIAHQRYATRGTDVPEKMNEEQFFVQFIIYQEDLMLDRIENNESGSEINWNEGYEKLIRNSIFEDWNTASSYPDEVLDRARNYKPIKN